VTSLLVKVATKIATYVGGIAAILAMISGCIAAVDWATHTFGTMPVALVGVFSLGCILTAAIIHARGPAGTP